jgi:putative ABC transport system permease protein
MTWALYISLAWRNLWRNRRRTLLTSGSVLFALVLALFMESMNTGQHEQIINNTLRFGTGYLQIQDTAFKESPSIDYAFYYSEDLNSILNNKLDNESWPIPRLESFVLAAGEQNTKGALIIGIDPEAENRMNGFMRYLSEGKLFEQGAAECIMGEGLAKRLGLSPGDTVVFIGQGFRGMQAAGKYLVSGLLKLPMNALNDQLVYMDLDEASWLFSSEGRITSLLIMSPTDAAAKQIQSNVADELKNMDLAIYHWTELQPDLVKALAFDSVSGKIFQLILYLVISFGIFGTILTMTLERQNEFAILISIGMKRSQLAFICLLETLFISFLGVIAGIIVGFPVLLYFYYNPIPLSGDLASMVQEFGMEPFLTFSLAPPVFIFQALTMLVISLIITTYPVWRSFTLPILENIRR